MAINKKQSSLWVKATIIFVVLAFVITALPAIFLGGGGQPQTPAASETAVALERISATHLPAIMSYATTLESDPTSYTVLVAAGNTYFDWGFEIRNAVGQTNPGQDLPMWNSAIAHYERALAIEPDDPNVRVDLAIAYFYSGQGLRAMDYIEEVVADEPEFVPAFLNAGIFYRAFEREPEAIAALQRVVELDPEGQNGATARTWLGEMGATADPDGGAAEETATP